MKFKLPGSVISLMFVVTFVGFLEATEVRVIVEENVSPGPRPRIDQAEVCLIGADGSIQRQITNNNGVTVFLNVAIGNITVRAHKTGLFNQQTQPRAIKPVAQEIFTFSLNPGSSPPVVCNVQPPPDIKATLHQSSANPVLTGSIVDYVFSMDNPGSVGVSNVTGRVSFPAGFRSASASGSGVSCSISGGSTDTTPPTILCTAPSLPAAGRRPITITVKSPSQITGNSQNFIINAAVDPDNAIPEGNNNNNVASVTTVLNLPPPPNLAPDLTGSDLQATVGDEYAYSVKVKNIGGGPAGSFVTRITLPPAADFVRTENSNFASCPVTTITIDSTNTRRLTCQSGTLDAGSEKSVRIIAIPKTGSATMLFSVGVDPDNEVAEQNEQDNTAFVQTIVASLPDLKVTATSEQWSLVVPTALPLNGFDIHVRVKNDGFATSPPTKLRVVLPHPKLKDLNNACTSGSAWSRACYCCVVAPRICSISALSGIGDCDVGSIAPGSSQVIDIHVKEGNPLEGSYQISLNADVGNDIVELDENNNLLQMTID